jgi:chromosome segregation ATPase
MGIKSAYFDFSQNDTILITGENGQGKSSVLRAIALCLSENKQANKFSEYVSAGQKNSFIKLNAKVGSEVIGFDIVLESEDSGGKLSRTVMYKGKEYTNSEVTTVLDELNLKYYSDIIMSMQGEGDVTKMTPTQLGKYIQKLLDFEFSTQIKKLDDDIKGNEILLKEFDNSISYRKNEIDTRQTEIQKLLDLPLIDVETENINLKKLNTELRKISITLNKKSNIEKSLLEATNELHILETKKLQYDNEKRILEEKKSKIESQKKEQESLTQLLTDKQSMKKRSFMKKKASDEEVEKLENDIKSIRLKKDSLQESKTLQAKYDSDKKIIKDLEEKNIKSLTEIKIIKDTISTLSDKKSMDYTYRNQMAIAISSDEETIKDKRKAIAGISSTLTLVKHKLDLFQKGKCPECGQDLHKAFNKEDIDVDKYQKEYQEMSDSIADYEKKLSSKRLEKEALSKEYSSLEEQIKGLNKQVDTLDLDIKNNLLKIKELTQKDTIDYSSLDKDLETIILDLSKLEKDLIESRNKKESYNKEYSSLENDITSIEDKITTIQKDIDSIVYLDITNDIISEESLIDIKLKIQNLDNELKNIGDIPDIAFLNMQIEEINTRLKELEDTKKDNVRITENNEKIRLKIESLTSEIEETQKKSICLQNETKLKKDAKTIFEKSLPNYLIVKTCSALQSRLNDFVQTIFPNITIELNQSKSGLNFSYRKDGLGPINVKLSSGFESQVLSVGFRVALCQAYNLGFIILDECDSMGSEEKSGKLFDNIISPGAFNQLICISHKVGIRDVLEAMSDNLIVYMVDKGIFSVD